MPLVYDFLFGLVFLYENEPILKLKLKLKQARVKLIENDLSLNILKCFVQRLKLVFSR